MVDQDAPILLQGLTRLYRGRRGIEAVDLEVPAGSVFGFLGPNGAGKTTTIRVLLGLLRPTAGTARVFGLDCWRDGRRIRADLGYLPGDLRLYPWLTGREALRIWGSIRRRDLRAPGAELADELGLDLTLPVRRMSRGTRQKVGIILALAHAPRLAILDEPTSALDPLVQERLRARLRGLASRGHTVFFSSHTLGEVESLCDRLAIVKDGRIVHSSSLESLRRSTGHEVTLKLRSGIDRPPVDPPPGLDLRRDAGEGARWRGRWEGPTGELLAWLTRVDPEEVAIGRPDLETLFARYYGGEGAP